MDNLSPCSMGPHSHHITHCPAGGSTVL